VELELPIRSRRGSARSRRRGRKEDRRSGRRRRRASRRVIQPSSPRPAAVTPPRDEVVATARGSRPLAQRGGGSPSARRGVASLTICSGPRTSPSQTRSPASRIPCGVVRLVPLAVLISGLNRTENLPNCRFDFRPEPICST